MKNIIILFGLLMTISCSGGLKTSPIDQFIRDLDSESTFSIILWDMDLKGTIFKRYLHKYKIITEKDEKPEEKITDWHIVDKSLFSKHQNNVGMEIVTKTEDGKIHKTPSPAGYSNYVGNEKYGQWRNDNRGNSFWEFYGKFAFMSSMFNLMSGPIYRSSYYDYRDNYSGRRAYYGRKDRGGNYTYGTFGNNTKKNRSSAFSRKMNSIKSKTSSFKNRVSNRVSRSSGRSNSSSYRSRSSGSGK